jgi:hypothetical protein
MKIFQFKKLGFFSLEKPTMEKLFQGLGLHYSIPLSHLLKEIMRPLLPNSVVNLSPFSFP